MPALYAPESLPTGPLTVQQIIDCYSKLTAKSCAARTIEERRRVLDRFAAAFGGKLSSEVRAADLVLWIHANPGWASDWTIKRVIATVRGPFNWAEKLGIIERNPLRGVSHECGEDGRSMAVDEYQTLMRNYRPVFRRVLVFLRYSGCRPGEMSALEWDFIDFERGLATLFKHKTSRSRKDRKPRTIILHPVLLKLLRWLKTHGPHERWVFVNARGRQWTRYNLAKRIKRTRRKLGLSKGMKLYGLRHFYGSEAIRNRVPIKLVSVNMGHSSVRTTERYVHVDGDIEVLRAAIVQTFKRQV